MRARIFGAMVGVALAGGPVWAQMHKVAKPQQVVRAVGVYEWTGDMAKPTASRLVPVSLFIEGDFQDAGVYMPQPVPFALETGNIYELKDAGADKGTVELEYARHMQTANGDYDDGWFGYGTYKPLAPPKPVMAKKLPPARTSGITSSVKDTAEAERPTFARTPDGERTAGAPEQTQKKGASSQPSASQQGGASASDGTTSTPADDPDRPVLKRRTPEEKRQAQVEARSDAAGMDASLNEDPNRPKLHLGRPAGETTGANVSKLVGLPANLHQMVAVSDAVDREPHDFTRPWEDAAERAAILKKMEAMAEAKLTAYAAENAPVAEPAVPSAKKTASQRTRRKVHAAASVAPALMDEELKGYTLSYGGDPTYVYMAHTAALGGALRYVTVVAQTDAIGQVNQVLASATDAAHLDRTPEMKFVDVVDADASNRASLLFELREQSTRQFALYRVIAGRSQQVFVSGTTQ
ncbi:hypothetical protein [Edaphobacter sp.]|uniref:hypothetical protein n=1 Tax=Edaphobacter sp. TaxID=1934404 RepID=UPI002DB6E142|nr:hypothetical protein [Edaphobacter sp.]HEU5342193.1 hypothetical protein [Edaphobacter sp.]